MRLQSFVSLHLITQVLVSSVALYKNGDQKKSIAGYGQMHPCYILILKKFKNLCVGYRIYFRIKGYYISHLKVE